MTEFKCPKDDFKTDDSYRFVEHLFESHKTDGYCILAKMVLDKEIKIVVT
jgi:hypothetical protein